MTIMPPSRIKVFLLIASMFIIGLPGCTERNQKPPKRSPPLDIVAIPAAGFAQLTARQLQSQPARTIQALSVAQLNSMNQKAFETITQHLTKEQILQLDARRRHWMPLRHMEMFTVDEIQSWGTDELRVLSAAQIGAVWKDFYFRQLFLLSDAQLWAVPGEAMTYFPPEGFHALTAGDLNRLSDSQFKELEPHFSEDQVRSLLGEAPQRLASRSLIRLSPDEISTIPSGIIAGFRVDQLMGLHEFLSFDQMLHLPVDQYPLIPDTCLENLTTHQVEQWVHHERFPFLEERQQAILLAELQVVELEAPLHDQRGDSSQDSELPIR